MLKVDAIDHLVISVRDVERSAQWYQRVLGMTREDRIPKPGKEPRTSVKFGVQKINLRPMDSTQTEWVSAEHATVGSTDLCFVVHDTPASVIAHLRSCGVAIEQGPVRKIGAMGTITSAYCRDPDGNLIEISSYD